ncbi:acetate uptake transporter [Amycolatopsis sp. K13G38]|uniref:Acetate uptake transporter n=1 Tax=Amycolatopsis acididurans TaxID=2724524 RepID=A0ABX1JGW4_9PSEU|nr:acetate uptake transporter [Amycolatopsis acididurans]NKQ58979.1 acetate uptake transporter [Amycolatopsis acididurans]
MSSTDTGRTTVTSGGSAVQPVDPTKHIADPGPLGLAGFAATTFVLSAVNAGLVAKSIEPVVLPLALFYGGLAQLLAGMWEFRKNNTFGATAFGTYGPFWLAFAFYVWQFADKIPKDQAATATGMFLLVFTIFTGYMTIASLRTSVALIGVFLLLFLTFLFLTIGELSGSDSTAKIGGWLGLVTAVLAWYASFASVTNSTFKRTILPVVPLTAR